MPSPQDERGQEVFALATYQSVRHAQGIVAALGNRGYRMARMHRIALQLYLPTLGCLLLALASTWLAPAGSLPVGAGVFASTFRWLPYGLCGFAAVLAVIASLRLRRWQVSDALICGCGGLPGSAREGRFGPYRTCPECGRRHVASGRLLY